MADPKSSVAEDHAREIAGEGKNLDYEQKALDSLQRSWELTDPVCQQIAVLDAQVWATLHLARQVGEEDDSGKPKML